MMVDDDLHERRQQAQYALLDLVTATTGIPIGWYTRNAGEVVAHHTDVSLDVFEPHCRYLERLAGGRKRCRADECRRADQVFRAVPAGDSGLPEPGVCHAGLFNQPLAVVVAGEVRAVMLFGQMLVTTDEHMRTSLERHAEMVRSLGLSSAEAEELKTLLLGSKRFSLEEIAAVNEKLGRVQSCLQALYDVEDRSRASIEHTQHEVQIRLQAIVGAAENHSGELADGGVGWAVEPATEILHSAMKLAMVVRNMSQSRDAYRFRYQPIRPVLEEAVRLFRVEARERGIEVRLAMDEGNELNVEFSRVHLQCAINNLVDNAVKYSFHGGPGRPRWVEVACRSDRSAVQIEVTNFGVGILPDEIASRAIFEHGYRGALTAREYRTGSGMGLALVADVVRHHNGHVSAESIIQSGDTSPQGQPHRNRFTVRLPLVQPAGR